LEMFGIWKEVTCLGKNNKLDNFECICKNNIMMIFMIN